MALYLCSATALYHDSLKYNLVLYLCQYLMFCRTKSNLFFVKFVYKLKLPPKNANNYMEEEGVDLLEIWQNVILVKFQFIVIRLVGQTK